MLDDLSGVVTDKRRHKGVEDVSLGRPTWPWSWLAQTMDGDGFAELQNMARAVSSGADAEPLARELGRLVAPQGKRRVHAHVEHAFARLATAVPHAPALSALRLELERLERSYV
jgi:hypothetical protein